ncbi:MAG: DUF885 family protein, partial [Planctomycetota bacterium]
VETPPYLSTVISGIAYQAPGAFDGANTGKFYVRPLPADPDRIQLEARFRYIQRRGLRGRVVHEGYPGHHLMNQVFHGLEDPVRKWQTNSMFVEGWALYGEEMMYDAGLYGVEDLNQKLQILSGIRFRAARVIADVKLHTGQFTVDECVNWMSEVLDRTTESSRQFFGREVSRYCSTPTYQMSYLMGKRELMKLKEAMQIRDGAEFSLAAFHDALLAEGAVPPALFWQILDIPSASEQ